ncbi:MAG: chitin deacetylase family protein [Pseudomonadota bacterium]
MLTLRQLLTLLLMAALLTQSGCSGLEPRWLLRSLPGSPPEVVYFIPTEQKLIALTIDDGPDPETTGPLLDLLKQHNARATFFFITDNLPGNEALVQRALAEGHELGNHMTVDEVSAKLPPEEFAEKLAQASSTLQSYGAEVRWFRPGSAWYNDSMREAIEPYGYRIALASMPPLDARLPWPAFVGSYIRRTVKPGSIVILHTSQGRGPRTLKILADVLPELTRRGYRFVTLSQLDAASESEAGRS